MINDRNIEPGTVVYVARRGLEARHWPLYHVMEMTVVKRTPKGYRLKEGTYEGAHLDSHYYISPRKDWVCAALVEDGRKALREVDHIRAHLIRRIRVLSGDAVDLSEGKL